MTVTISAHEPQRLALCLRQAGLHRLPIGTTLVTLEGSSRLEPPSRLVAAARYILSAGHMHVVETSGWWCLRAGERSGAYLRTAAGAARTSHPMWSAMGRWLVDIIQLRQTSRG